jgi:two-component system cell cycle sensor histidine kinase/response regulator CckA
MAAGETSLTDHQGASRGDNPPQTDEPMDPGRVLIHDFRNLLAVIVNYAELIGEELTDPEAIKADIQEIKAAAERAIAMTDELPRPGKPAT